MREFLNTISSLNKDIVALEEYVEELRRQFVIRQNGILNSTEESVLDSRIDIINENFLKLSESLKLAVSKLQEDTDVVAATTKEKKIVEMRQLNIFRLKNMITEIIRKYQGVQVEFKEREKRKLKSILKVADPRLTEEELDQIIIEDDDATLESAFSLGTTSAQNILNQARSRQKQIQKIVVLVNTLVALIEDINTLVKKDNVQIDRIFTNMEEASECSGNTNNQLDSALLKKKRSMRLKRFFIFIFLIIAAFIVYYLYQKSRKYSNKK